jgi:16S rRNA (uracil1498-N3)-methyltransferase
MVAPELVVAPGLVVATGLVVDRPHAHNPAVSPRSGEAGTAAERRFFLAGGSRGGRAELRGGEARHATQVVRLHEGDRLIGLDGKGGSWPARVVAIGRDRVEVEIDGEGSVDPRPGEPGADLPWIEIAVAWPTPGRLEEMLDRLTQLGAAAIAGLPCERAGPRAGPLTGPRRERSEHVLREACKQSGRTWLPVLRDTPGENAADTVLLDPDSSLGLPAWLAGVPLRAAAWRWTEELPLRVLVGPEGGFTESERERWLSVGAVPVRLGPYTLRLETAAEAAMAVLAAACFSSPRT